MIKMRLVLLMSILLAVGCSQKDRMKVASKPREIKS